MTAKKNPGTIQLHLPSGPIAPGSDGLALPVSALVRNGRPPTPEEQYIGNKLRTDLAVQLGVAIKSEHGFRLSQTISMRTVTRMEEFIAFDRAVRDKPRGNPDDQADMEMFCNTMRQAQANTLLAVRQAAVNRIEEVVATSLNPPEDLGEEVIVEHKPGLLGLLFGGQQVTRVKR